MSSGAKAPLASGEVETDPAGGILSKEIAAGEFLLCCSTQLSDLAVKGDEFRETDCG